MSIYDASVLYGWVESQGSITRHADHIIEFTGDIWNCHDCLECGLSA